jgi:hypothetical protein
MSQKISTAPLIFMLGCALLGLRDGQRQEAAIEVLRSAVAGEAGEVVRNGTIISVCGHPEGLNARVCVAISDQGEIFGNGENPFSTDPAKKAAAASRLI